MFDNEPFVRWAKEVKLLSDLSDAKEWQDAWRQWQLLDQAYTQRFNTPTT